MPITTARDFVTKAYAKLEIGAEGETLSAAMMNDGLDELNMLIESLSGNNLLTTANVSESFLLVANQSAYTIGLTSAPPAPGVFNSSKPFTIISAFVRDASGNDYPLEIISRGEYNEFTIKTTSGIPERLFYDPGATQQVSQVGTISLYPCPDAMGSYTLFLFSEKPLTPFLTLNDVNNFPDFYNRFLVYNLAMALAPDNHVIPHSEVEHIADESARIIEGINSSNKRVVASLDLPGCNLGRPDIFSGR